MRLHPEFPEAQNNLGTALLQRGQIDEAIAHYQAALKTRPDFVEAYSNLRGVTWRLATSPDASMRNGGRAIALARQMDQLSGGRDPVTIETLAAAYAEASRFPDAVAAAERAVQMASAQNNDALVTELRTQLRSYRLGQAYREPVAETTLRRPLPPPSPPGP